MTAVVPGQHDEAAQADDSARPTDAVELAEPATAGKARRMVAASRAWLGGWRSWPLGSALAIAVAAGLVFTFVRNSLVDDAYITLSYARNLAFEGHWGLTPHDTSNTATSPLNVLVLAAGTAVLRGPVLALGAVFVGCALLSWYCLRRVSVRVGLPGWVGLLAVGFVLVNPLLISSIGLEVMLGAALSTVLLVATVERRPALFGVIAGLLVLTRVDLIIVVAVFFVVRRSGWRRWWLSILIALAVVAPWFAFSWFRLGSFLPDTLFIKTVESSWSGLTFVDGWLNGYLYAYPGATVLAFLPAALGLLAAIVWAICRIIRRSAAMRRLDTFALLAVAGVLHYVAYSQLGVPPYHWYYGSSLILLSTFLAAAIGMVATTRTRLAIGPVLAGVLLIGADAGFVAKDMKPLTVAPISTNWAASKEYAEAGPEIGRLAAGRVVYSGGEIGALAFFCQCSVIDQFSDRGYIPDLIDKVKSDEGRFGQWLVDLNFRYLDKNQRPPALDLAVRRAGTPTADAIASWPVSSPWIGPGYLELVRANP